LQLTRINMFKLGFFYWLTQASSENDRLGLSDLHEVHSNDSQIRTSKILSMGDEALLCSQPRRITDFQYGILMDRVYNKPTSMYQLLAMTVDHNYMPAITTAHRAIMEK